MIPAFTATRREPLAVLIAALGGQGGGVLTDWIGQAARAQGFVVQATSTPGVSQRTGATTYYLEIAEGPGTGGSPPVLGLTPLAGRVDVLVCAELLEAARMLERGMCTAARTTVVASTHRTYTTLEKMSGGDGRYDDKRIVDAVRALSRRATLFDMESVRARHRATISAALFGALAGSGALPLTRERCESAIREAGKGVTASLAAFADAFERAAGGPEPAGSVRPRADRAQRPFTQRIDAMPAVVADVAREGAAQVAAYQDVAYAMRYVDRLEAVVRAEAKAAGADAPYAIARETARCLALWMCYDDILRVAALKCRAARFSRIRREVRAADTDIVRVFDLFKPGAAEIADILPHPVGRWLERVAHARSRRPGGRAWTLQSSSVSGALALRLIAGLRGLRPRSLRFFREQSAIERWLAAIGESLVQHGREGVPLALELARLPRLRKGYGETHAAGEAAFRHAMGTGRESGGGNPEEAALRLREMMRKALDVAGCDPPAGRRQAAEARSEVKPVRWMGRQNP